MTLRPAVESDLLAVSHWVGDAEQCRTWAGPSVDYPIDLAELSRTIRFADGNAWAIDGDDALAGFGQLLAKPGGNMHLARIITNPALRGHGYGRELCAGLIKLALDKGATAVSLNVYRANAAATGLYFSLGFIEQTRHSNLDIMHMVMDPRRTA